MIGVMYSNQAELVANRKVVGVLILVLSLHVFYYYFFLRVHCFHLVTAIIVTWCFNLFELYMKKIIYPSS